MRVPRTQAKPRESRSPGAHAHVGRGWSAHAEPGGASVGHYSLPRRKREGRVGSFLRAQDKKSRERRAHAALCKHKRWLSGPFTLDSKINASLRI